MNLARIKTRAIHGIKAQTVTVEVHISNGLPAFAIVGLAETAVKESRDRVRSALLNSQFEFPARKITVNLAPADLPKSGCGFDLPIAIGILCASEQVNSQLLQNHEFVGELALSGEIRRVKGVLPMIIASDNYFVIPEENSDEAAVACKETILQANHLLSVCSHLNQVNQLPQVPPAPQKKRCHFDIDWSDIKGQSVAKRALEIAASGGHNALMFGPPGSGKTMLAQRMITVMPQLSLDAALECASIASIQGQSFEHYHFKQVPFRAPHHTASAAALVGGGNPPKPGEVSLAHNGILFLDELPEFSRQALETLREPLESGKIHIARAANQVEFPANFQLITAMNPCPCGQAGSDNNRCLCTAHQIHNYLRKLSGPLLDRIDIHLQVDALSNDELTKRYTATESSELIKKRVMIAQKRQLDRQNKLNAATHPKEIEQLCQLNDTQLKFIRNAMKTLELSARSFHRILRVAQTIADLEESSAVKQTHLTESLSFKINQLF